MRRMWPVTELRIRYHRETAASKGPIISTQDPADRGGGDSLLIVGQAPGRNYELHCESRKSEKDEAEYGMTFAGCTVSWSARHRW